MMVAPKFAEQNADFSHSDYWKSVQNGSFIFWVILEIKRQLAFAALAQKFSGIRHPELTSLVRI